MLGHPRDHAGDVELRRGERSGGAKSVVRADGASAVCGELQQKRPALATLRGLDESAGVQMHDDRPRRRRGEVPVHVEPVRARRARSGGRASARRRGVGGRTAAGCRGARRVRIVRPAWAMSRASTPAIATALSESVVEVLIECGLGAAGAQLHPEEAERDQRRHGDARRRRGGVGPSSLITSRAADPAKTASSTSGISLPVTVCITPGIRTATTAPSGPV